MSREQELETMRWHQYRSSVCPKCYLPMERVTYLFEAVWECHNRSCRQYVGIPFLRCFNPPPDVPKLI